MSEETSSSPPPAPESPAPDVSDSAAVAPERHAVSAPSETEEPPEAEAKGPAPPAPSRREIPFRFLIPIWLSIVLLIGALSPIVLRLESALKFPYQLDSEEGFVFKQALDLYLGESIYRPIDEEPYLVGNYPPLFPRVVSFFLSPERIGLPLGRAVVLAFCVALGQALILITYFRTRRVLAALLAPLLFFVTYEFHNWSALCRVDLPALTWTLLGLGAFLTIRPRWGSSLAALFFVLAGFTRQTAVFAPIACCLALALNDRRRLIWFLGPYIGLGGLTFLFLNIMTGGEFWLHTVSYNRNEMDWTSFLRVMRNEIFFFYRWWILGLAMGGIFWFLVRRAPAEEADTGPGRFFGHPHARGAIGLYAAVAGLGLLGFAKIGSAPNYGLEPLAAAALLAAEMLARLCDSGGGVPCPRRRLARAGVLAMSLPLLVHSLRIMPVSPPRSPQRGSAIDRIFNALPVGNVSWAMFSSRVPGEADLRLGRAVYERVREAEGEVLSEFPIFSILARKEVLYEPFIMARLATEGVWDQEKILEKFRNREFALIVTSQDLSEIDRGGFLWRFTPEMARTILAYYKLDAVVRSADAPQAYFLWVPDRSPADLERVRHMTRSLESGAAAAYDAAGGA